MEAQQTNNNIIHQENDGGSNSNMKPPSFLCRQSSTRWTPTTDQIRILKELYYNNGIRSPSADQIQRISARLRQYGKIEGKNVFYWFQNHKARERQKKRFTTTPNNNDLLINNHMNIPSAPGFHRNNNTVNPGHWRSSEDHSVIYNSNYASPTYITPPPEMIQSSSHTPAGFAAIGQIGSHCYGSVAMEQSFRECSISPNDYHHHQHSNGAPLNQHIIASSVPTPYPFLDKINSSYDHQTVDEDEDDDDDHQVREIETLPLFPMHREDHYASSVFNCNTYKAAESSNGHNYYGGWYQSDHIGARASLELSLNTYGSRSTNPFY